MGIEEDMSLGWARDVGFRSGVSRAFQAYDLEEERSLHLRIHPVAVMDVGIRHNVECQRSSRRTDRPDGGGVRRWVAIGCHAGTTPQSVKKSSGKGGVQHTFTWWTQRGIGADVIWRYGAG